MNDAEKQKYLKRYKEKKAEGELFFPHSIAKDAVVSLLVFIVLILLAVFLGVPNEPPANPADSSYIPRPEWYFLWMFQLLKYFPGELEGVAIVGLGLLIGGGPLRPAVLRPQPETPPAQPADRHHHDAGDRCGHGFSDHPGRGDDARPG